MKGRWCPWPTEGATYHCIRASGLRSSPLLQEDPGWGCLSCRCGKTPAGPWLRPLPDAPAWASSGSQEFSMLNPGLPLPRLPGNSSGIHTRSAAAWPWDHLLDLPPGPQATEWGRGGDREERGRWLLSWKFLGRPLRALPSPWDK